MFLLEVLELFFGDFCDTCRAEKQSKTPGKVRREYNGTKTRHLAANISFHRIIEALRDKRDGGQAEGSHPGVETRRAAVGCGHFHLAPPPLRLLVAEPHRRGRAAAV